MVPAPLTDFEYNSLPQKINCMATERKSSSVLDHTVHRFWWNTKYKQWKVLITKNYWTCLKLNIIFNILSYGKAYIITFHTRPKPFSLSLEVHLSALISPLNTTNPFPRSWSETIPVGILLPLGRPKPGWSSPENPHHHGVWNTVP